MATTRRDDRLEPLIEAGITIAAGLDLEAVLSRLIDLARELTGARYAAVGVLDSTGTRIARFITSGVSEDERAAVGHPPSGRGILGTLISEARPVRVGDLARDPRSTGFPPNHPPMRNFLGVPVMAAGTVFGNLYLTDKPDSDFSERDEQVVVMLAAQAGVAVHNARLYRQAAEHARALERALGELSSIHEIAEAMLADAPRDEVLQLIAERAQTGLHSHAVGVALPDPSGEWLSYVAAAGEGADRVLGLRVPIAGSKMGTAFRARRGVVVADLASDPDAYAPAVEAMGLRSQAIVPLLHRSRVLGVMTAGERLDGRRLNDDDRRMLEAFATRAVLALEIGGALAGERERAEAEARLLTAELREASRRETLRRVVEAQERERRRIALELHDETGQALASVLMGLRLVEEADAEQSRPMLRDLRETVNGAIRELRALAVELRPKALDDFGLGPALERLTDTYAQRSGIAVDLHTSGLEGRLPEEVETAIYRIVQEGLTNVAKHAEARHVSVMARRGDGSVALVLEDDGRGFDAGSATGGLGLVSMQERAQLLAGSFRIETSPGAGTTIAVEVPL